MVDEALNVPESSDGQPDSILIVCDYPQAHPKRRPEWPILRFVLGDDGWWRARPLDPQKDPWSWKNYGELQPYDSTKELFEFRCPRCSMHPTRVRQLPIVRLTIDQMQGPLEAARHAGQDRIVLRALGRIAGTLAASDDT